jgi:hypothetical protein
MARAHLRREWRVIAEVPAVTKRVSVRIEAARARELDGEGRFALCGHRFDGSHRGMIATADIADAPYRAHFDVYEVDVPIKTKLDVDDCARGGI